MREVPVMLPMVRSTAHKFPLCEASSLDLRNYVLVLNFVSLLFMRLFWRGDGVEVWFHEQT